LTARNLGLVVVNIGLITPNLRLVTAKLVFLAIIHELVASNFSSI